MVSPVLKKTLTSFCKPIKKDRHDQIADVKNMILTTKGQNIKECGMTESRDVSWATKGLE